MEETYTEYDPLRVVCPDAYDRLSLSLSGLGVSGSLEWLENPNPAPIGRMIETIASW